MTPVEIIAVIFAIVVLVKVVLLYFIDAKPIVKHIESMSKIKVLLPTILLVVAIFVGAFLMNDINVNPATLFVGALFGILVNGLTFVVYPKEMIKVAETIFKDKKPLWLSMVVWVILALYVLYWVLT